MNIPPLGDLQRDHTIDEWFLSGSVSVPYLGGDPLEFILEGIEDDDAPEDFTNSIRQFLELSESDRAKAAPYVFENYRRLVEKVGDDILDFTIPSEADVWAHVSITGIHVSRRFYAEKDVYVQLTGNCDWEQEHGFQIVLKRGNILARVSDQDGHLTTADAFGLPESQNTITYQG